MTYTAISNIFPLTELHFYLLVSIIAMALLVKVILYYKKENSSLIHELRTMKSDDLITDKAYVKKVYNEMSQNNTFTRLPSKDFLKKRVDKMIHENKSFSIALLDIDNFKKVKTSISYTAKEELIQQIAIELKNISPDNSFVTHLSGDEFALVFKNKETNKTLEHKIRTIHEHFNKFFHIETYELQISMSIGVASFPNNGANYNELMRNANIAMDRIKTSGKNNFLFFQSEFTNQSKEKIKLSKKIQTAIEEESFEMYYQPQVDLKTGQISGLEALLRWNDPKDGFISPGTFIPLAEETGQIYSIEKLVFNNILKDKQRINNPAINFSINLSSKTLMNELMFYELVKIIESSNKDLSNITIEITETAIISDLASAIDRINYLKTLGFSIALDDFGTGYSSLTHLKELPIDQVKIDRSFIENIIQSPKDQLIIESLVSLSHKLNYLVTIEGIETKQEYSYMKSIGADKIQGYYISKPIPFEAIQAFFKKKTKSTLRKIK